ncbi:hypothetical protein IGI04_035224 [Brassica rapa subsp. trilocularis]|uniref:Uncharacterized protein n=1 Tax=Brassica rapa subsp. trilocularis TaxID=1813537 RepID=A0ABQ7LB15_BRACM|nr:hypothetical protein IGI04_035224 [Brassica rapa subsp. trilocularis]
MDRMIKGDLYNGRLGAYIMLRDKGPNGIRELPWDLLDGLEGSDAVHKLKEKELLEFECKSFQIRQVGVNEDPFDPMLAGARYGLVELLLAVYDVSLLVEMLSWSPMSGLKLIEPASFQLRQRFLLNPMMGFGSGRSFLGLESPSKVGYSQMDGVENL